MTKRKLKNALYSAPDRLVALEDLLALPTPWPRMKFDIAVGPAEAEELFRRSANRRSLRPWRVNAMAKHMEDGDFVNNMQPILFDRYGLFVDGNNRMAAVIKSGQVIETSVGTGLTKKEILTLDDGSARSTTDALKIDGQEIKHYSIVAAGLSQVWRTLRGSACMHGSDRPDSLETIDMLEEWGEGAQEGAAIFSHSDYTSDVGAPAGEASGLYAVLRTIDPEKARRFAQQVVHGLELTATSPAYLLRKKLREIKKADPKAVTTKRAKRQMYFLQAWKHFYAGNSPSKLMQTRDARIPPVTGWNVEPLPWTHGINSPNRIPDFDEEVYGSLLKKRGS